MQFVPPIYEQTPIRCSGCHERFVGFVPVRNGIPAVDGYSPDRCACGHLEEITALPPGKLFGGVSGDPVKRYHPLNRPN